MASKEVKELMKRAEEQGWRVEMRSSGHVMFFPANREFGPVTVGGTISDHRGIKNAKADLKKRGMRFDGFADVNETRAVMMDPRVQYQLGLRQLLGEGGFGVVYMTDRGTVIKGISDYGGSQHHIVEAVLGLAMQELWGSPGVPYVVQVGRIGDHTVLIEREPLGDLERSRFFGNLFWDFLDKRFSVRTMHKLVDENRGFDEALTPSQQVQAHAIITAAAALQSYGFFLDDVETRNNWGIRQDGSIVVRDWGRFDFNYDEMLDVLQPYARMLQRVGGGESYSVLMSLPELAVL